MMKIIRQKLDDLNFIDLLYFAVEMSRYPKSSFSYVRLNLGYSITILKITVLEEILKYINWFKSKVSSQKEGQND